MCATAEHKALCYTTLSEPHTKLEEHLTPFTFFDKQALGSRVEYIHLGDMLEQARTEGSDALTSEVVRKALTDEPAIVVIDSVKKFRDFVSEHQLRTALYRLTSQIAHSGAVLLLLGEYTPKEIKRSAEFSLADGILQLTYQPREPVDRRWMRVVKMRGGSHLEGQTHLPHRPGRLLGLRPHRNPRPRRDASLRRPYARWASPGWTS